MASSTLAASPLQLSMDLKELDAVSALLGVSPSERLSAPNSMPSTPLVHLPESLCPPLVESNGDVAQTAEEEKDHGGALDALVLLASKEQEAFEENPMERHLIRNGVASHSPSSSDEDSEVMPPPPRRRPRSASNPEGMEKWDSYARGTRRHFVLPASIIEEELAEASAAIRERKRWQPLSIPEDEEVCEPEQTSSDSHEEGKVEPEEEEEDEVAEEDLTPDELLRRARSRLLEDLSENSVNNEKGDLTLPHSLDKYKKVYNKNGRIGIYTPAERAAIISRFNEKRSRRVWNKKIRYNCRKSLADRRLRVKGRFVKRSEQEALARQLAEQSEQEKEDLEDEDMPDVNDPEAGFQPTDDQPYRRTRRHTFA